LKNFWENLFSTATQIKKMKKSNIFVTISAAIILLISAQNLAAQNNETPAQIKPTEDDHDDTAADEGKAKELDYQLTVDKVDPSRFNTVAVIQGLNKITAKTSLLEIKIGSTIKFGRLSITAHKCWQSPLEQRPESKILLEIFDSGEVKTNEESKQTRIFYGWMFSSSPSISALEHPIYDITAVNCKNK
jgi:hypothetical protein